MKKNDFSSKFRIKVFFFSLTAILAVSVLYYTNLVVEEIVVREKNNLKLFAAVYQHIGNSNVENTVFIFDRVMPAISYPMVLTLEDNEPLYPYQSYCRNVSIDSTKDIAIQKEINISRIAKTYWSL